jgi:hypothetical protein
LKNNALGGKYSSFQNTLQQPLLKVKGLQLIRANFVNPILQLNDTSQLMFFYYQSATATPTYDSSYLRCIRLLPSYYVPPAGFTAFVRNQYFNSTADLVTALNAAASTGGDSTTYNPTWLVGDVSFAYDTASRRITMTGLTSGKYYAPAAADDPNIKTLLAAGATTIVKMNVFGGTATYAGAVAQPQTLGQTMNPRLGFAMSYSNRGIWWSSSSVLGAASMTGVPQANTVGILADSFPILIGSQNINIYLNARGSTGQDSRNQKNLLATIPLEQGALYVNSYTLTSLEQPAHLVTGEIYNMTFSFQDDYGNDVQMLPNYNTNLELNVFY